MEDAESVLHAAHVGMASLIGELETEYQKAQWLGHLDAKVASAVLEAKSGASRASLSRAIGVHVTAMCVRLAKLLGEARGGTEKVQAAARFLWLLGLRCLTCRTHTPRRVPGAS